MIANMIADALSGEACKNMRGDVDRELCVDYSHSAINASATKGLSEYDVSE
jgi:hypothetical protein